MIIYSYVYCYLLVLTGMLPGCLSLCAAAPSFLSSRRSSGNTGKREAAGVEGLVGPDARHRGRVEGGAGGLEAPLQQRQEDQAGGNLIA